MFLKSQKGISLFYSLIILSLISAAAMALSVILIAEIKITRGLGNSVIAFYAADTGAEKTLMDWASGTLSTEPNYYDGSLSNGASYDVDVFEGETNGCLAPNYCITSKGTYRDTSRKVELIY